MRRLRPFFFGATLLVGAVAPARSAFVGTVTMEDGATALSGVTVNVINPADDSVVTTTLTDSFGAYSVSPAAGTYHLRVQPVGYFPSQRTSYVLPASPDVTVNFALQASGEAYRDDFSATTGWSQPFGATSLTSNGNVMKYRSALSGGSYHGILKSLGATYSNVTYPFVSIRNKVTLNSGKLQGVDITYNYCCGWGLRTFFASGFESRPWQDRTYAVPFSWTEVFMINDADDGVGSADVDHYLDSLVIHTVDRGYVTGTVKNASGSPLAGVRVEVLKGTAQLGEVVTDSAGAYELWVGTASAAYTVRARKVDYQMGVQSGVSVAGRTATTANFTLPTDPCTTLSRVRAVGGGDYTTIQAAVDAVPALTGNYCIQVDSGTYAEQVTVRNISVPAAYRLTIMSEPGMTSSATVNPPAASTAAFHVMNPGVTLIGFRIAPASPVTYGVHAASADVKISSVMVDSGGRIFGAGILLSSGTRVEYSSVTVQDAHAFWIQGTSGAVVTASTALASGLNVAAVNVVNGSSNTFSVILASNPAGRAFNFTKVAYNSVRFSTGTSDNTTYQAFMLFNSSWNTVEGSVFRNSIGTAFALSLSHYNTLLRSTAASGSNLFQRTMNLNGSSTNTVDGFYVAAGADYGLLIDGNSNGNSVLNSVVVSTGVGRSALFMTSADSNTLTNSYFENKNDSGAHVGNGSDLNVFQSTFVSNHANGAGLYITASDSNTVTGSYVSNPGGPGLVLCGGADKNVVIKTTVTAGSGAYGLSLSASGSTTVLDSYLRAATAAYVSGSTETVFGGNAFYSASAGGSALIVTGGSVGLLVSSNTVSGGSEGGRGILIDGGSGGSLIVSTNTVLAGPDRGISVMNTPVGASVWLTSNTVVATIVPGKNRMGIHLDGLLSGATVQNNGVYYRTPMSGLATAPLYVKNSAGVVIERNRLSNPGMVLAGDYRGIYLENADGAVLRFNDFHSTGTGLGLFHGLELNVGANGVVLRNNVFLSSVSVSGSSASLKVSLDSQPGFNADYNDYFSSNSFNGAQWGTSRCSLPNWGGTGCPAGLDAASISLHPQWASPESGDFHPRTLRTNGRFNPATGLFDAEDSVNSPLLDGGDPAEAFASEPFPNGGRVNLGSFGNTPEASLSAPSSQVVSFTAVYQSSATVQYSTDSADGYVVQATSTDFSGNVLSTVTAVTTLDRLTLTGLSANTTYTFRAGALYGAETAYGLAASTLTAIEAPTTVYFDEISSRSITASAYAPGPAFSSMTTGVSGVNIALDGVFAGWLRENWTTKADAPTARQAVVAAVVAGRIYVLGGGGLTNEEFDPVTNSWGGKANMLSARNTFAVASAGGKVYAVGGTDGSPLAKNEEYDPETNSWAVRRPMPTPRSQLSAAAVYGMVYAVGGFNSIDKAETEAYDPATDSWTSKTPISAGRRGLAAAALGGKIYAVGGSFPDSNMLEEYDPGLNAWSTKAVMPTARGSLGAAGAGGKLYVLGGSGPLATVERYDPGTDTWRSMPSMPTARSGLAAVASRGKVYALDGFAGGNSKKTEEFDPGVTSSFTALTPNTLYSFKAKARNSFGIESGESPTVSTYTLAVATLPNGGTPVFTPVFVASITVNWSSGTDAGGYNGPGASYLVQASTMSTFIPVAGSSMTRNLFATVQGLLNANTTHYLRIQAYNAANVTDYSWFVLGSTLTAIEAPTTVYFDEISSRSITASAYAPAPAFSSMTVGLSGSAISVNGAYPGGHGEKWTVKTGVTTPRYSLAAAAIGGRVYAVGGHNGTTYQGVNEVFDPVANSWSPRAAMLTPRQWLAAAAVGGKLYAVGDTNGAALTTNEEYDPVKDAWTSRAPLPVAREGLAAVAVGSMVYALGGNGALNATTEYDPSKNAWRARALMPSGRAYMAAATVRGKVYAIGGLGATSANEEFNPATNGWAVRSNLPTPRYLMAGAAVGEKVYVIGGTTGILKANEEYDPLSNQWTSRLPMPTARNDLAAAAAGGRIYAVGGFAGGALAANEEFDPGTASSFTALTPNTLYAFRAKARNSAGTETAETAVVSTYTLAAASAPQAGTLPFSPVFATSMTVAWSSGTDAGGYNAPGASYLVEASTAADFLPVAGSSLTAGLSAMVTGLSANATQYLRVRGVNSASVAGDWYFLGSTVTLANPALSAASTFTMVGLTSMTVTWDGNSNAAGTRYDVVFTTYLPFTSALTVSTQPYGTPSATGAGLLVNATYYPIVFTFNRSGIASGETPLGSTATRIETPATVLIDAVSTHSIVAVASSPTGAFSNLDQSSSAVNIARNGVYQDWVAGSSVTVSSGLVPNILYQFKAKARNVLAAETEESAVVSTYTLAFATVPAAGASPFSLVFASSAGVAWASGTAAGGFNGPGALYSVEASTMDTFVPTVGSSVTLNPAATVSGLFANATHYFRVRAANSYGNPGPWVLLGSTVTAIEAPSFVYIDEVTTHSIVASAYSPNPGFSNLSVGSAATNVAIDGVYAGWHGESWTTRAPLTGRARWFAPGVAYNGSLYVLGGHDGAHQPWLDRYDPASDQWTALADMPTPRSYLGLAVAGEKLHALAGADSGTTFQKHEVYDPGAGSWSTAADFPGVRVSGAVKALGVGRSVYLVGDVTNRLSERYDVDAASWQTRAAPPAIGAEFQIVLLGTRAFVVQGDGVTRIYEPAADLWSVGATMPGSDGYAQVGAAIGGKLYLLGGTGAVRTRSYDPATDTWVLRTNMPTTRSAPMGAAVGGRAYVVGGSPGSGVTPVNEEFDPGVAARFPGLAPNSLYTFKAKARNLLGDETAETASVSTYTLAAVPSTATPTFPAAFPSSVSVQWTHNGNPGGTQYRLHISTSPGLDGAADTQSAWFIGTSTNVVGLAANATFYFSVRARNFYGAETAALALGSTVTAAAAPAVVSTVFSSVAKDGAAVSWGANGNSSGTLYELQRSSGPFPNALSGNLSVSTRPESAPSVSVGLTPNTTWYFQARAVSHAGVPTPFVSLGSTSTLAAAPAVTTTSFAAVSAIAFTAAWDNGGNPVSLTTYAVTASTGASFPNAFSGNVPLTTAAPGAVPAAALSGLLSNTTFNVFVQAFNHGGSSTPWVLVGTTVTLPSAPLPTGPAFGAVDITSLTVRFDTNANANDTLFEVTATTGLPFPNTSTANQSVSTAPAAAASAPLSGLVANTTWYLHARASGRTGVSSAWTLVASTITAIETPTGVYFHAVSSNSLIAVASAPGGAFTGLSLSSSGANLALSGSFQGYVSGSSTAFFGGLTPNTLYPFRAKARNQVARETAESVSVSTWTLAAVPSSATPNFPAVWASSLTVQWGLNGNPAGTEHMVQFSTAADWTGAGDVFVGWVAATDTTRTGLTANTTYYVQVKARNGFGVETAFAPAGSTATLAGVPGSAASTFTAVAQTSMTLTWALGTNPAGTQFRAQGSTTPAFNGQSDVGSGWLPALTTGFIGLSADSTYYWRVAARSHGGQVSASLDLGPRPTLAYVPSASTEPFHRVWATSATVQWGANGNPPTTVYEVQASTTQSFAGPVADSGLFVFLSTTVTGLTGDATYYWRVRARGVSGQATDPLTLGTTATAAAVPAGAAPASVGPSSIRVEWGAGGNREADSVGSWSTRTPLPSARERHAGALIGGRVYVTGGLVAGVPSAEVWSAGVSPAGTLGPWRREADLPSPRESHALAAFSGRLYVIGGFDGSAKSTVFSADLSTLGEVASWRTETSLPAARFKLAAAAHAGWLYALGGDNGAVSQATVYRAPLGTDGRVGAWATATALPAARNSHAAAVSSGRVYVAGGLGAGVAGDVWSAALSGPSVGAWRAEMSLDVPVFRHQLLAGGGALIQVGGHDGTGAVADVRSAPLSPDGTVGMWRPLGTMPLARFGHAAVLETSNVLVLGGADDSTVAADTLQAGLGGTEYLLERADDTNFSVNTASSNWRSGAGAEMAGLTPNRSYFLRVRGRARSGLETSIAVMGSTLTPAAVPGSAASTFTLVEAGSVTLAWAGGGNPPGTEFLAALSTSTDFTTSFDSSWLAAVSSTVYGLAPNTTYYAAVLARDSDLRRTRELLLGSTVTAAAVPQSPAFPSILTTGLSVEWSTAGNPAGTRFEAQLSAAASFSPVAASSVTVSSGVAFSGLLSGATYYFRVRGLNFLGTPSGFSAATQAVTGSDFTPPAAITGLGLHATETPGVLSAVWTVPGDDGSNGVLPAGSKFHFQWTATDPATFAWSTAAAQLGPSTGPASPGALAGVLVTGMPVGSTVYARVWTTDESGNTSAFSSTAAAWVSPFTLVTLDGVGQDAGRWVSVALDRTGAAHAAYTAGTVSQELRYLTRSGGVWSVAEAVDPGIPAEEALLAMGASAPQVVYRNSSTGQLRLAKRSAGWSASAVASGDLHPGGLAVDATQAAHISYFDALLPGLRYARWNGAAWELETVEAGAGRGRFSSLALDGASAPHIAYYDAASGDLKFASRTVAGTWMTSSVDTGVDVGSGPVVALDGVGNAAVAYIDAVSKDLKFARYDGTAWSLSTVDSARDVVSVRGMALDGAARAVVTYHDGTNGDLVFARFNGTGWESGAVDSYGDAGAWSGVAVEPNGGILELHYDASASDLKAGTWNAGSAGALDGNSRSRAQAPAAFSGVVGSPSSIQWTWIDSASNELGWRLYGGLTSTGPFTVIVDSTTLPATAGTGTQRLYTETGLTLGTTYYRYVAAVSSGGAVVSPMAALFPFNTTDTAPPTVSDNQAGDVVWRRSTGTFYNVDFQDTGGSALTKFQVKASTNPGGIGPDVAAFTDVVLNILSDTYTADWGLPPSVFNAMLDGATHYLSVRVFDGAGNVATSTDVFTVLKDTMPPAFTDNQGGDAQRRAAAGTVYDVDVRDPASGLERFQYSVSTTQASADGSVLVWNDVPLGASTTGFLADWAVAFGSLLGDSTNFVSVRAWDRAGSTASLTDAFFVLKDTSGPRVGFSAPVAGFRSVLSALVGTAADDGGVTTVQVAIQTAPPTGNWFDGAAFSGGTPLWLAASGTAAWTFTGVPAWTDGGVFRVVARAADGLANASVVFSTVDFTFDSSTPTAGMTTPSAGATLAVLTALGGTALDAGPAPSGLAAIQVQVRRAQDGFYWDWGAGSWGAAAASSSPVTASPWSLAVPEALRASLTNGASYFVSARALDSATPANAGTFVGGSTFTWTDAVPPSPITSLSALTGPSPGTLQLSWTAPGDDGVLGDIALGAYRIHYSTDPATAFSTSAALVAFSTSGVRPGLRQGRLLTGLSAGATYHVRVFLADDAGNWSALSNGATAYAGNQPFSKIIGHVKTSSSQGVTAVLLEAYDSSDLRVSQTFTLADGSGTFSLNDVPDGIFRVQASWTAEDITSSVWLDGVAVGSFDVEFMLELNFTLSNLTGTLASLSAQAASPAGFLVRAAENGFADARVDLLRGGKEVAAAYPDPTGRWNIPNLLPGKYSVRAFNGLEYTDPQEVQLGEGETRDVVFVFDPLPEASVFAFPNPARSKTTFRFVSALPGLEAQVTIFDIAGTLVRELPGSAFTPRPGGLYHADWDLTNDDGESVASGVYLFVTKVTGNNGQSGKVVKKLAVVR